MKTLYSTLVLCSIFSATSIHADLSQNALTPNHNPPTEAQNGSTLTQNASTNSGTVSSTQGTNVLSEDQISQLVEELLAPYKKGLQLEDLITISSTLDTYFSNNSDLSVPEKRSALQSVLEQMVGSANFSAPEISVLDEFIPALAYVIFPDPNDETLQAPTDLSPSEQDVSAAVNGFITTIRGGINSKTIPSCIQFCYEFASSYSSLTAQDKAFLAKQVLGQILDKMNSSYFPDPLFNEIFERIAYPLIDYLISSQ